jgi:hypothetical protein
MSMMKKPKEKIILTVAMKMKVDLLIVCYLLSVVSQAVDISMDVIFIFGHYAVAG